MIRPTPAVDAAGTTPEAPDTIDAPASWRRSFEQPVRAIYAVVVLVTAITAAVAPRSVMSPAGRGGQTAFLAALALSAIWIWFRGFGHAVLAAVLVALTAAVLGSRGPAADWWAWQPWVTAAILTGAVCTVGGTVAVTAASSLAYLVVRLDGGASVATALSEIVAGWQAALLVCLVLRSWRRIAAVGDRSEIEGIAAASVAARVSAVDRADQRAARMLHDRVLHTLRAATAERSLVPAPAVAAMAADAVAAFDTRSVAPPAPAGFLDRLQDLAGRSGLEVPVVVVAGWPDRLPEPVCRALLDAAAEALRNVRRHAGVTSAVLTVEGSADAVELRVSDHGRGFDATRLPPRSAGLAGSVHGAMAAVHGAAVVRSTPGYGTEVTLRWPADGGRSGESRSRAADLMVELAGARRDLLMAVAVPEAAGGVLRCLLWAAAGDRPSTVLLSAVLGVAGLLTAAVPIWHGHRPGRVRAVVVAVLGVAALGAAGLAVEVTGAPSHGLATVEVVAPIVMMLAWQGRFRNALAVGLLFGGVAAVAATGTAPGVWGYLPQILLCPLAAVELRLLRSFVSADSRRVDASYRARRLAAQAQAEADAFGRAEARRMGRLRPVVLPALTALAAGRLDLDDRQTRVELTVLDAAIRDDLQIGAVPPHARQLIDRARSQGVSVQLTGPPGPEAEVGVQIDDLVELALGHGRRPSSLDLSVAPHPDGGSTVALLVRPGLPPGVARPTAPVIDTDDLTLLRLHVPTGGS